MYSIHKKKKKIQKNSSINTKKNIYLRKVLSKILRINKCYSILDYSTNTYELNCKCKLSYSGKTCDEILTKGN